MSKKKLTYFFIAASIVLSGCGKQEINIDTTKESVSTGTSYSDEYQITGTVFNDISLNALVISENTKNVISSKAGIVRSLNCEPGKKVKSGDLIAEISPDPNDVNIQNTNIQRGAVEEQISNLQSTINYTKSNYDAQLAQLKNQKDNNNQQIAILKKNIENLSKQQNVSVGDIDVQAKTIEDQITYLGESKNLNEKNIELIKQNKQKEIDKLKNNISTTNKQIYTTLQDCFQKIDLVFGITEMNKGKNDSYEVYLSAKNSQLKTDIENKFRGLKDKLATFDSMSDEQISSYIGEVTGLLKLAADAVINSVSSNTLPQSQIDTYYSTFINLANTSTSSLLSTKTSLDNMLNSLQTSENTYDNQINSLQSSISTINSNIDSLKNSLENLKGNKTQSTYISVDTNINTLQGQITSLESSNRNIDEQTNGVIESKNIQITSLNNQIVSLNQSLRTLGNNVYGEKLYAGVNGIVKNRKIDVNNKIASSTLICEIINDAGQQIKLQIYAPQKMQIGQEFQYIKDNVFLGTGSFENELPYKDTTTQNYIYETSLKSTELKEGDKVTIKLTQEKNGGTIWVPIQYMLLKLDGQYVNLKTLTGVALKEVEVGNINNGYVKILSGLNSGDVVVR